MASAPAAAAAPGGWVFPVYVACARKLPASDASDDGLAAEEQQCRHPAPPLAVPTARFAAPRHECSVCSAALPTAHLLDLHVTEVHDSYFAARAARRLPVYLCLVEGCGRHFTSVLARREHLVGHHRFPKGYNLDRQHLRRRKAQIKPFERQRVAPAHLQGPVPGEEEDLTQGLSRLSVSAAQSPTPEVFSFGRRSCGGGMIRGRGRGP